nr:hypothetical protein [Drepanopeziza brunnea f. sp. 'multigermtubi']
MLDNRDEDDSVHDTETENPIMPQAGGSWLQEVKAFAKDFEYFKDDEKISTPIADQGIEPVKYAVEPSLDGDLAEMRLQLLTGAVRLEKILGDYWFKTEATLMVAAFGVEDPVHWLPVIQCYAIRKNLQEHRLLRSTRYDNDNVSPIIQICNQVEGNLNRAEILLLAQFTPDTKLVSSRNASSRLDLASLADILFKHQREKARVEASHCLISKLFLGAEARAHTMLGMKQAANNTRHEANIHSFQVGEQQRANGAMKEEEQRLLTE